MTKAIRTLAAAAGVALVAAAGAASAQGFAAGSGYLKAFGGATWPSGQEDGLKLGGTGTGESFKFDYDTGYTLGASIGYMVMPNVALEVEYAHRNAGVSTELTFGGSSGGIASNDINSNSIMFNALYMFDGMGPTGAWQPYVGGGLGGASVTIDAGDEDWNADTLFAYQLIGGVGYQVAPQWTLFGEARWFATEDGSFEGDDDFSFDSSLETFDLLVGAAYNF